MMGGHKGVQFTLTYRLELTREEADLVDRYKLSTFPITFHSVQGARVPDDTIGNMLQGRSTTLSDVTTLLNNENVVKDACDQLPVLFDVCRSFGGDEIIDYPRV